MMLLTKSDKKKLIFNHTSGDHDKIPVVKFFCPWTAATWIFTEYDEANRTFFGLCDLGLGSPELGYVTLDGIESVKGPMGLRIERDRHFSPGEKTLNQYAEEASEKGKLVA